MAWLMTDTQTGGMSERMVDKAGDVRGTAVPERRQAAEMSLCVIQRSGEPLSQPVSRWNTCVRPASAIARVWV